MDFDVAVQVINLSYYCKLSADLECSLSERLLRYSRDVIESGLEGALNGEPVSLSAVLQINPVNALTAILATGEEHFIKTCVQNYAHTIERLFAHGENPFSDSNQPLLKVYLQQIEHPVVLESFCEIQKQLKPLSDVKSDAAGFCQEALLSSKFGAVTPAEGTELSAMFVQPLAMAAIRRRDTFSLASMLIADCLSGQQRLLSSDYEIWLRRTQNEFGLFGAWAAHDPKQLKALLATTLQAYRALECIEKGDRSVVPGIRNRSKSRPWEPKNALVTDDWSSKLASENCSYYCSWIEKNFDRFEIANDTHDYSQIVDQIKPSVELALTLYLIVSSRRSHPALKAWAKSLAERLYHSISWSGLIEFYRMNPSASLGLLIFPLTAKAAGFKMPFAQVVKDIILNPYSYAQERSPMRKMDFGFLARLSDVPGQKFRDTEAQLEQTLLGNKAHPLWYSVDGLYDTTHAIFYATDFGIAKEGMPTSLRRWIGDHLPSLVLESLTRGDLDLAGEFALCSYHLGQEKEPKHRFAIAKYVQSLPGNRPVPGPGMDLRDGLDEFDTCYHTTLVAVLALSEILGTGFSDASNPNAQVSGDRSHQTSCSGGSNAQADDFSSVFPITVSKVERISQTSSREKLLVYSNDQRMYVVSKYNKASDWPTIIGTANLAKEAAKEGLCSSIEYQFNSSVNQLYTLREFIGGTPLTNIEKYCKPSIVGAFSARFHRTVSTNSQYSLNDYITNWSKALDSDLARKVPKDLLNTYFERVDSNRVILHGDLLADNLIVTDSEDEIFAIDLDQAGIGLPEQEIALILASKQNYGADFKNEKELLIDAYCTNGGQLDRQLLDACIVTAPVFIFYSTYSRGEWDAHMSKALRRACLLQVRGLMDCII